MEIFRTESELREVYQQRKRVKKHKDEKRYT